MWTWVAEVEVKEGRGIGGGIYGWVVGGTQSLSGAVCVTEGNHLLSEGRRGRQFRS